MKLTLLVIVGMSLRAATPADVPTVFEPGTISGPAHDSAPAFTPDGKTVYFARSGDDNHSTILESRLLVHGNWTQPVTAAFSGKWSDMEPAMSPDGRFLIFISNRPVTAGGKALDGNFSGKVYPGGGGNLWRTVQTGDGWSEPVHLPATVNSSDSTFAPSVTADGSIYFMRPSPGTKRFQIFRAQSSGTGYLEPQAVAFSDGKSTDVDVAVAPDESFLVFGSSRSPALTSVDLFFVGKVAGQWATPQHMGNVVNSPGSDAEARLSPDHRTLYFSSDRKITSGPDKNADWNNGKYNIWFVSLAPWLVKEWVKIYLTHQSQEGMIINSANGVLIDPNITALERYELSQFRNEDRSANKLFERGED